MVRLIHVLGDQLSPDLSALRDLADDDVVFLCEVAEETEYVPHHPKKIAFILSAMRHFAEEMRARGATVDYVKLDDDGNEGDFSAEVARAVKRHEAEAVICTEAGEWRVREMQRAWAGDLGVEVDIRADDRFICDHDEFNDWADGRKQLRMEYFYREMRRKTGLLMEGDEPKGCEWNYDAENRKPAKADLFMPTPPRTAPDEITGEVLRLVEDHFSSNFGNLDNFWFAVTREGAEASLDEFIEKAAPRFGDYQDAMLEGEAFLYHSVLSLYINVGLLDPLSVCRAMERAHLEGDVPLNAAEGFIRQIIGWREYVRGVYWREMPSYPERNALDAKRPLPGFYWTGETDMACLSAAIGQTRDEAYAHHIQRLMVTGLFALLIGADPAEVHEWYLAVYADAFEWVEAPNVIGMSQFADGGLLASKPYAASGSYIDRMSDYCGGCRYNVKKRTEDGACPFNSLYWDFMARNRETLDGNPRLGMAYRNWDRMKTETQDALRARAAEVLGAL